VEFVDSLAAEKLVNALSDKHYLLGRILLVEQELTREITADPVITYQVIPDIRFLLFELDVREVLILLSISLLGVATVL